MVAEKSINMSLSEISLYRAFFEIWVEKSGGNVIAIMRLV